MDPEEADREGFWVFEENDTETWMRRASCYEAVKSQIQEKGKTKKDHELLRNQDLLGSNIYSLFIASPTCPIVKSC